MSDFLRPFLTSPYMTFTTKPAMGNHIIKNIILLKKNFTQE